MRFAYRVEPTQLTLAFLSTVSTIVPELVLIITYRFLADASEREDARTLTIACGVLAAVGVAQWFFSAVADRARLRFADRVTVSLETHVARLQATAMDLEHHERADYVDRLAVLRDQVFALNKLYLSFFSTVAAAVRAGIALALLASVDPALALLGLFALPPVIVASWCADKARRRQEKVASHNRLARHLFVLATEAGSAKELRTSRSTRMVLERQQRERATWYRAVAAARWRSAAWQSLSWLLFGMAYTVALLLVVQSPAFSPGDVIVVLIAGSRISQYLGELVTEANFLRGDWLGASQRLAWLEDHVARQARSGGTAPARLAHGIELRNVTFRYPGTDRLAIEDVNLFLPAGAIVALVGENGAGKSTMVKLLCQLYVPTAGEVLVDGTDLRSISPTMWRERLTGTFQDFFKFELRARHVVGVGDLPRAADDEAVRMALAAGGAADVIEGLDGGLEAQLGATWPAGTDLSFGQWQKLAVARGLMRGEPLLRVLDEPSAALDAETENQLFERYAATARADRDQGTLTLLVSHRFSTVRMADLIVVLHGACIVEQGTHEGLMASDGHYAALFSLQANNYA